METSGPGLKQRILKRLCSFACFVMVILLVGHRYDILLLRLQLGHEEEFIRCLNVSCNAGQFHSGAGEL